MTSDKIDYGEAASITGLSINTLYALVSKKLIPHFRVGKRVVRFSREELTAWILEKRVRTETPQPRS